MACPLPRQLSRSVCEGNLDDCLCEGNQRRYRARAKKGRADGQSRRLADHFKGERPNTLGRNIWGEVSERFVEGLFAIRSAPIILNARAPIIATLGLLRPMHKREDGWMDDWDYSECDIVPTNDGNDLALPSSVSDLVTGNSIWNRCRSLLHIICTGRHDESAGTFLPREIDDLRGFQPSLF